MKIIADLEVHSKYARAVSPSMTVPTIAEWSYKKGIGLVGTGDFTHPLWFRELQTNLVEAGEGVYQLKGRNNKTQDVKFLLTSEVSCIYSHKGKVRRVHLLVYLPLFSDIEKFNKELTSLGANLFSDGRPIIGLSLAQVAETALSVNKKAIVIPAHVWTPWFGYYGSMSGYDSLADAFGTLEKFIPAVETGLSSDPAMNWKISELAGKNIVSFGDAHSPQKLGREATVFELPEVTYENIWKAIWDKSVEEIGRIPKVPKILYTIEFYPEEGKYHYSGHRKCGVVYSANDVRKNGLSCPVCGKRLTLGVMSRVGTLASGDIETISRTDEFGVRWIENKENKRPGFVMLVPLAEILSEALSVGSGSQKVKEMYNLLVDQFRSEFSVLLETPLANIAKVAGERISEGIMKVRGGDIIIKPGYDGVFGKVKIWHSEKDTKEVKISSGQTSLFEKNH